jgi:hypothetical protein
LLQHRRGLQVDLADDPDPHDPPCVRTRIANGCG